MPREPLDPVRPIYVKPPSVSPVPAMDAETELKLRKHFHADEAVMPTTNETISRLCGCQESYWPERLDDGFMLNGKPCYPDRNEADALAALERFCGNRWKARLVRNRVGEWYVCLSQKTSDGMIEVHEGGLCEKGTLCAAICAAIIAAGTESFQPG